MFQVHFRSCSKLYRFDALVQFSPEIAQDLGIECKGCYGRSLQIDKIVMCKDFNVSVLAIVTVNRTVADEIFVFGTTNLNLLTMTVHSYFIHTALSQWFDVECYNSKHSPEFGNEYLCDPGRNSMKFTIMITLAWYIRHGLGSLYVIV